MKQRLVLNTDPSNRFLIERTLSVSAERLIDNRELFIRSSTPSGFDIMLFGDSRGVRACFGGLEFDFDNWEQAAIWSRRALSSTYELRITILCKDNTTNGRAVMWELGPADGEGVSIQSGTQRHIRPGQPHRIVVQRNDLFK